MSKFERVVWGTGLVMFVLGVPGAAILIGGTAGAGLLGVWMGKVAPWLLQSRGVASPTL